jgi:hypothetical protein
VCWQRWCEANGWPTGEGRRVVVRTPRRTEGEHQPVLDGLDEINEDEE